jgi:hypothetical protein
MMKFSWHEAFVNAKKWIDKINYFDLYIKAFSKRALFFGVYLNYFGRDRGVRLFATLLSSRLRTRRGEEAILHALQA